MLAGPKLRARPGDRGERVAIENVVWAAQRGGIVIAKDDDGTIRRIALDQLEHGDRIGTVADVIAEERIAGRAQRVSMSEAGRDRLEVAVDIGEQSELQGAVVSRSRYPIPRSVTISTPADSSFLRNRCT